MYEISYEFYDLESYEKNEKAILKIATACGVDFVGVDDFSYPETGTAYLDFGWKTPPTPELREFVAHGISPLLHLAKKTA